MINSFVNFSLFLNRTRLFLVVSILSVLSFGLTACDSTPPKLMPAVKQFETEQQKEAHLATIRNNHKDLLMHKRDETMIQGIRTKKNSLNACINCHVPEQHNGKVLRHTDSEHFCSTCHGYVAAQIDCFDCHVDHPVSKTESTANVPNDSIHSVLASKSIVEKNTKSAVDKAVKGDSTSE